MHPPRIQPILPRRAGKVLIDVCTERQAPRKLPGEEVDWYCPGEKYNGSVLCSAETLPFDRV
jgi:hypothetical protein